MAEGSNADDGGDYRPGKRAVAELSVLSPLAEAGFTKAEVRALAKELGLDLWNKPSAPCLATRFPYGTQVTREGIAQVASGRGVSARAGFRAGARAPLRQPGAPGGGSRKRSSDWWRSEMRSALYFKQIGFTHVAVDLLGYRSGSLNEGLTS